MFDCFFLCFRQRTIALVFSESPVGGSAKKLDSLGVVESHHFQEQKFFASDSRSLGISRTTASRSRLFVLTVLDGCKWRTPLTLSPSLSSPNRARNARLKQTGVKGGMSCSITRKRTAPLHPGAAQSEECFDNTIHAHNHRRSTSPSCRDCLHRASHFSGRHVLG